MNFCVDFSENPKRFSAQFHEDDQSFEGFGRDLQLVHGKDGKSAYEVAVENGFEGTEEEWLESIKGNPGGYYSPEVTQTATDTVQFAFNPSAPGMPAIEPAEIKLPVSGGGGGVSEETDPTVPDWAKQPEKPKYTAEEVGGVTAEEVDEKISTAIANIPNPSWDDLEDRPFGVGATEWEQIASASSTGSYNSVTTISIINLTLSVELGRKYRIVFRRLGESMPYRESTVIATQATSFVGQHISLGTNEDDIYGYQLMAGMPWTFNFKNPITFPIGYDFILYEAVETLTTLDEKFIPDTIARTADIPTVIDDALRQAKESGEFDGKDGISPIVTVTDITGGHRVTITDVNGEQTFDVMDGKDGEGGTGGGAAIIDVTELPTENINEDVFYRKLTASFVCNQFTQGHMICHCVNSLPEVGEPAVSGDLSNFDNATITTYYNAQDESVMAYVTDELSGVFGAPAGWYPVSVLMGAVGYDFVGVIADILEDPKDGRFRVLLKYVLYSYKEGWSGLTAIGRAGTGANAEEFNHVENRAGGDCSHAEGIATVASRRAQHVHGEMNIQDTVGIDRTQRGKYIHIVGNGDYNEGTRSNAHTLDWDGLGWFAGGLKVGGTGQDDPTAVSVLTTADMATITQSVISALPIYNGEVESV